MSVAIRGIAVALPDAVVSNDDLAREHPQWDMARVAPKSGVRERRIAAPGETALDLAARAADALFAGGEHDRAGVDAVVFCTQSPDYIMPSNAFLLHRHLGLGHGVMAFDYNLACSGYVYGLVLARALVVSGTARSVLLATGDTYSRYIHPGDRSARVLFGDGAAVTLLGPARGDGRGVIDFMLGSSGEDFDKFFIPAGGLRTPRSDATGVESEDASGNVRSANEIHMDGLAVWSFIQSAVPRQIRALLERNGLTVDDVDLFVFHQASKLTLDSLVRALRAPPERVFLNLERVGNTVSASIPIALHDAEAAGRLHAGDRVLLSGFGVGLSWGSLLMRW